MTNGTESMIRGIGIVVMAIAIGVFLFRRKEGGAQLSVFNQSLSVSRESLVVFAIGVLLLVFPEINRNNVNPPAAAGDTTKSVRLPSSSAQTEPAAIVPSTEAAIAASTSQAEPLPPSSPVRTNPLDPDAVQKQWFAAVSSGDIDRIERMVRGGSVSIITPVDDMANTALHLAAERCDAALITYLLAKGLNPDRHNAFNDSPRTIAAARCGGKGGVLNAFPPAQ